VNLRPDWHRDDINILPHSNTQAPIQVPFSVVPAATRDQSG